MSNVGRGSAATPDRREAGMVTAETAVVLPVLLLVLAGAVAVLTAVGTQLRCGDAAREGARSAARGDAVAVVTAVTARAAPAGAGVEIGGDADQVRVTVSVDVAPLGPLTISVRVSASAMARRESAGPVAAVVEGGAVARAVGAG